MVRGIDGRKIKKKPWKNKIERDIYYHKDITEAGLQGGKALGHLVKPKKNKKNLNKV